METHIAVYYGSSKIDKPEYAVGGFVKYNIPVTKSIFFSNIDSSTNTAFNSENNELQSAITTNPAYFNFLLDLYRTGNYEIALHTLDPWDDLILNSTTNSDSIHASMHPSNHTASIDSAFSFMQDAFNTVTSIDHGMSDGFGNRESFVSDGLIKSSGHYMSDYWERYGIKYFWNSSIEKYFDCGGLKQKLYNLNLVKFINCYFDRIIGTRNYFMTGDGEQIPAPSYWQNNFHKASFYSWGTLRASGHHPGWVWDYKYRESVLDELVENHGLNIIHFYPAFIGRTAGYSNGIWEFENGIYKINEDFDSVLKRMAAYREMGLINLTTIRDYLDFQIALEKVEISPMINGKFKIINKNNDPVDGITFYLQKDYEIETSAEVESKLYKNNIYYWFSLAANEDLEFTVRRSLR